MLLNAKRTQPRERGPIILPPQTPRSIHPTQRLSQRSADTRRVPGQIKMLQIGQQGMGVVGVAD
jgi:hypothetical protein